MRKRKPSPRVRTTISIHADVLARLNRELRRLEIPKSRYIEDALTVAFKSKRTRDLAVLGKPAMRREVERLRAQGLKLREVAEKLNERGLRTAHGHRFTGERLHQFIYRRSRSTRVRRSRPTDAA